MKSKRWGFAAITAAIVATFCVVGPTAAHADPTGPTVTSVDRSGAYPVVTIDWGANSDAPVGVLESVDGYKLGTPADMASGVVDHHEAAWYGPRSYRAAACYDQCDADSISAGRAALVEGPWFRPDVGDISGKSAPTMDISWGFNGFDVIWVPGTLDNDAVMGIYRNGVPVGLASLATYWDHDGGPFTDTATYTATACYLDCAVSTLGSGAAVETAQGESQTFHAASPPVPTTTSFSCHDGWSEVGVPMRCETWVGSAVFAVSNPTGSAEFRGDDDTAFPPTSCTLQDGMCEFTFTPGQGSGGTHDVHVSYPGDGTHSSSESDRSYTFDRRPSYVNLICPARDYGQTTTCTVDVGDGSYGSPITPTGRIDVNPDFAAASLDSCALDAQAHCTVVVDLSRAPQGNGDAIVTYSGDADHLSSTSTQPVYLPTLRSRTIVSCAPSTVVAGQALGCTARVTDTDTGAPVDGIVNFVVNDSAIAACFTANGTCSATFAPPTDATGPLVVAAEFAGDVDYWPSTGMTSVIVMRPTAMTARPAIANAVSPTKVNLKMSATLTDALDHSPIAGETVRFVVNGTTLCTGVTDASGVATCSGLTQVAQAAAGYKALFDGDDSTYRLKSSASGAGVRL